MSEILRYDTRVEPLREATQKGADVNAVDPPLPGPLLSTAVDQPVCVVATLIEHGADVNSHDETYGNTPLHGVASSWRDPEIFEAALLLLAAGANVNARNNLGNTPLHVVRNPRLIDLLLDHGADPRARNEEGEVPDIKGKRKRWRD